MKTSRSRKRPKLTYWKGSSGKINPELAILRHILVQLLVLKNKDKILKVFL